MSISFRPAVRENVGLLILLSGGTGSGKSYSSLQLATGIAGGKKFAFIDTENRRGLHYADMFDFDYAEIKPPFRPDKFIEAVEEADKAGYPVIVIDSGSAVWEGSGGILEWQVEELDEMVKRAKARNDNREEWKIRESGKMAAWIQPKMSHKKMVQKLLQVKAHVILCLRADEKIEIVKDAKGKTVIQPKQSLTGLNGWISICEKSLPFEATCSFLLMADKPGTPRPIKLQEQHKSIFPLDHPISAESGKRLAEWAAGGKAKKAADIVDVRKNLVKSFAAIGVTSEQIETFFEKSVDKLTEADIASLRSIYAAMQNEGMTWIACTNPPEVPEPEHQTSGNGDANNSGNDLESEDVVFLRRQVTERIAVLGGLERLTKDSRLEYERLGDLSLEETKAFLETLG